MSGEKQKAAQERESQMKDTKNIILSQALDQNARARRKYNNESVGVGSYYLLP